MDGRDVHVPTIGICVILGRLQAARGGRPLHMSDLLGGTGPTSVLACDWYDAEREENWPLPEEASFTAEEAWWRKYRKGEFYLLYLRLGPNIDFSPASTSKRRRSPEQAQAGAGSSKRARVAKRGQGSDRSPSPAHGRVSTQPPAGSSRRPPQPPAGVGLDTPSSRRPPPRPTANARQAATPAAPIHQRRAVRVVDPEEQQEEHAHADDDEGETNPQNDDQGGSGSDTGMTAAQRKRRRADKGKAAPDTSAESNPRGDESPEEPRGRINRHVKYTKQRNQEVSPWRAVSFVLVTRCAQSLTRASGSTLRQLQSPAGDVLDFGGQDPGAPA